MLLMNLVLALFVALSNRNKAALDELAKIKSSIGGLDARILAAEANINNAVDDQDLIAVHRRVDEIASKLGPVQGRLDEMAVNLQPLNATLQSLGQQLGAVQGMLSALIGKDK